MLTAEGVDDACGAIRQLSMSSRSLRNNDIQAVFVVGGDGDHVVVVQHYPSKVSCTQCPNGKPCPHVKAVYKQLDLQPTALHAEFSLFDDLVDENGSWKVTSLSQVRVRCNPVGVSARCAYRSLDRSPASC